MPRVRPRRLPFLLLALVLLLPLLGLGWLGWRLGLEQDHAWQRELNQLLQRRLVDSRVQAMLPLRAMARRVDGLVRNADGDGQALVTALRRLPFVEQVLLLGPGGDRRYPPLAADYEPAQAAFLQRTRALWQGKVLLHAGDSRVESAPQAGAGSGWLSWHWGQGLELLYWQRAADGGTVAVSVDSISLLGDIIAALPDGAGDTSEQIQLRDGSGRVLYQWGGYRPGPGQSPRLSEALAAPLDSWQLRLYFNDDRLRGSGARLRELQLGLGLGSLALVLLGLGIWLYRELRRAEREATGRVNFVNQVSHELRTPLTNIRMYAELLEDSVEGDPPAQRKLAVIISESRRLGRLIANVLSFARQQKNTLRLNKLPTRLDPLLQETCEHFRPGLAARGIELQLDCNAPVALPLDPDAVAGIIGNLLSNAEKYAPGRPLRVRSGQHGGSAVVTAADSGPGISRGQCRHIFEPFFRAADKITEGVSGTGIGLSIARDLARLHGGELRLLDSPQGAVFELSIPMTED